MNKYERFVLKTFTGLPEWCTGIETRCFFEAAARAKLYVPGTYGSPISKALEKFCDVECVQNDEGVFLYHIFTLKEKQNDTETRTQGTH